MSHTFREFDVNLPIILLRYYHHHHHQLSTICIDKARQYPVCGPIVQRSSVAKNEAVDFTMSCICRWKSDTNNFIINMLQIDNNADLLRTMTIATACGSELPSSHRYGPLMPPAPPARAVISQSVRKSGEVTVKAGFPAE